MTAPKSTLTDAEMVGDWLTIARSCGQGIQDMVNVDKAEGIMLGLVQQVECDKIDLADARATIKRQAKALTEFRSAYAKGYEAGAAVPSVDPVGKVCPAEEGREYNHFKRLREPRDDEVGAYLYAIHDAAREGK